MRVEIILNVLNNWVPLSPLLSGKRGNTTLKFPDMWIVSRGKSRTTFETLFRPQRIPKEATNHRLGDFALRGRIGNGCIIQIIILSWDNIVHTIYVQLPIRNSGWEKVQGQQPLKLNFLWIKSLRCYLCECLPAAVCRVFPSYSLLKKCSSAKIYTQDFIQSRRSTGLQKSCWTWAQKRQRWFFTSNVI